MKNDKKPKEIQVMDVYFKDFVVNLVVDAFLDAISFLSIIRLTIANIPHINVSGTHCAAEYTATLAIGGVLF